MNFDKPSKAKKSLGQNFLTVEWPIQKITNLLTQYNIRNVLEIGPGKGILTKALKDLKLTTVVAIEKDDYLASVLQQDLSNASVTIVHSDILKFDVKSWLNTIKEKTAIVGNIPYNLSSEIVRWIMSNIHLVDLSILMVQEEFAQRLLARPNSRDYSSLSVSCRMRSEIIYECAVGRDCFFPIPKVDSAIIYFTPRAYNKTLSLEVINNADKLAKHAFLNRRKKIKNALKPLLDLETTDSPPSVDLDRRPDSLSPDEYLELAKKYYLLIL